MTIDLLDALDSFMDAIRDSGIIASTESDELRNAYWDVRKQVDAWRDELQPPAIYPEPAPIENCPHPYDRDFAFLNHDEVNDEWYITRACTVCGNVDPPHRIGPKKRKQSKQQAITQEPIAHEHKSS